MIVSMFIIGKVLIAKILFNPNKNGFNIQFTDKMVLAFKLLSTVLYHTFLEYMN